MDNNNSMVFDSIRQIVLICTVSFGRLLIMIIGGKNKLVFKGSLTWNFNNFFFASLATDDDDVRDLTNKRFRKRVNDSVYRRETILKG